MHTQLAIMVTCMVAAYLWLSADPRFQEVFPSDEVGVCLVVVDMPTLILMPNLALRTLLTVQISVVDAYTAEYAGTAVVNNRAIPVSL